MLQELQRFHKSCISTENNVAQNTLWLHCVFPTMEVKPNLKYSSKYLRFLSMATIERYNMFLPDCWLQFHNNNNLLLSKTTTVLKQDRPSASIDTSDIPLVVYFTSDLDNRRARLWMIKLTHWTMQQWSDDGKTYLLFRLRPRMHTLPIIFCNILYFCKSYFATYDI